MDFIVLVQCEDSFFCSFRQVVQDVERAGRNVFKRDAIRRGCKHFMRNLLAIFIVTKLIGMAGHDVVVIIAWQETDSVHTDRSSHVHPRPKYFGHGHFGNMSACSCLWRCSPLPHYAAYRHTTI